jgi:hypothetical protein
MCVRLSERYIPRCFEIPMNLGFRWVPMWTASSVRTQNNPYNPSINGSSPFYRAIWDVFSLSLWDKACLLYPTSRNPAVSYGRLWPFKHDLREWAYRYIEPVYCFFAPKRVVFPMRGEPLPDEDSFPWSTTEERSKGSAAACYPINQMSLVRPDSQSSLLPISA